jgi:hypothetical protein
MAGRLYKEAAVARSGVYQYLPEEIQQYIARGLLDPKGFDATDRSRIYNVYRPALVLEKAAPLYTKQPITVEHPDQELNSKNVRDFMVGMTGDSAKAVWMPGSNEIRIITPLTLLDQEAIDAYEDGTREVSPGYEAKLVWKDGVSPNGEAFDIVMDKVLEVNHLALCPGPLGGRGGAEVAILDSKGGAMKPKTGLLWYVKKKLGIIKDSKKNFRDTLSAVIKDRAMTDEAGMSSKIDEIKKLCADLPESDEKAQLIRFIDDLKLSKDHDDATANEEAAVVSDMYDSLDEKATAEVKPVEQTKAPDMPPKAPEAKEPVKDAPPAEPVAEVPEASASPVAPAQDVPAAPEVPAATGDPAAPAAPAAAPVLDIEQFGPNPGEWSEPEVHSAMLFLQKAAPFLKQLMQSDDPAADPATDVVEQPDMGEEPAPTEDGMSVRDSNTFLMPVQAPKKEAGKAASPADFVSQMLRKGA